MDNSQLTGLNNSTYLNQYSNQDITAIKEVLGKVNKLSNKGWSYHFRLLRMDQNSLTYYKSVPSDFDGIKIKTQSPQNIDRTMKSQQFEEGKIKVKQSIPIKRILAVDEIQEEDKKKFKKLAKASDIAFKVVFPKKYMIKSKEYNPQTDDPDEDEEDEEEDAELDESIDGQRTKMKKSKTQTRSKSKAKSAKKAQTLTTWYFVCDNKYDKQLWMERLITSSKMQNSRFIDDESNFMGKNELNNTQLNQISGPKNKFMEQNLQSDEEEILPQKETRQKQLNFQDQINPKNNKNAQAITSNNDKAQAQQIPNKVNTSNNKNLPSQNQQKQQAVQQIELFGKNTKQVNKFQNDYNEYGRSESEYPDLDTILEQNLQINNVKIDGEGNIDQNINQKSNDDSDGELVVEDSQEAKLKLKNLQNSVNKYFQQSDDLNNKKSKKEQKGWDLKFQNYWGYLISADKNLKDSMTLSERFFDHVGKFRRTAQQLVQEIIDEIHIPVNNSSRKNKYTPVQKIQEEHLVFLDDDDAAINHVGTLFYFEKNICIKITHQGDKMLEQNGPFSQNPNNHNTANITAANRTSNGLQNSGLDNSYLANNQNQNRNSDPFQNLKWKMYGREFLSMDVMFDALFLLSKPDVTHKLRIPLSALIDYKGFRALAIAAIPIHPQLGPSIGFYTDGKYVPHDKKLKQELEYVGDVLNLKENRISQKGQQFNNNQNVRLFESVPVSFFVKIYHYQQPESKNTRKDPDTPTKKSQEYHFSELQYLEEPYYVLKTSEIFPYDVDLNEVYPRKDKYLRPEFVCVYERPLKADARKDLGFQLSKETKSKDDDNDQVELNEASRFLKYTIIPNLVNLLDSLIIMPIDSESLTTCFHSQGVNMRYLGLVCQNSNVPHVQQICKVEMIGRTLKNILNKQISSMILDHQKRFVENIANMESHRRQYNSRSQMNASNLKMKGTRNNVSSIQLQQQEYEQKEKELQDEHQELQKDLDVIIKQSIVDYINLVFGGGEESREFWTQVLIPYAQQYFNLQSEDMLKQTFIINYNAVFFSFINHAGIRVLGSNFMMQQKNGFDQRLGDKMGDKINPQQMQKDDDFFKEFGKSEMPFGDPEKCYVRIELVPKSKTYGLRNLPYKLLSDKYKEYKEEGQIENALKCCKMRRIMKRSLEDREDISTLAEICEISLDNYEFKIAKEQAIEALRHIHPLHAEAIKFYCILMRSFHGMEFFQEQDQYFTKALTTLGHHWGNDHPLHCTIFGIMAYLLIQKNKLEEAGYLYNSSHICCLKVLGSNHIQTAEVHMDFGRLYLKMKSKDAALEHFQNAYLIYESYFGVQSLSTAQVAQQLANILEEQGKLNEAYVYADIASDTYPTIYGDTNEKSISSHWLKLSISYSLRKPDVMGQCSKLYDAILKRDIQLNDHSGMMEYSHDKSHAVNIQNDKNAEYINDKIQTIKEYCIATTILEMTRSLKKEDRLVIKMFCDKVLFKAHQQSEQGIPNLSDLQQQLNPSKIMHVSNLKFDEEARGFFETLYQFSRDYEGGFVGFYQKTLDAAMSQMNESKKQTTMQASSTVKPNRGNDQNLLSEFLSFGEGPDEFFKRTIKAFENYNFYNVLLL